MTAYLAAARGAVADNVSAMHASAKQPSAMLLADEAGRRCAVSMLALACTDLALGADIVEAPKSRHEKDLMRNRDEAKSWLQGSDDAEQPLLTFVECCDTLGWDPAQVRDRILTDPAGIHDRYVHLQSLTSQFTRDRAWESSFRVVPVERPVRAYAKNDEPVDEQPSFAPS
jgi:hypothetical protein